METYETPQAISDRFERTLTPENTRCEAHSGLSPNRHRALNGRQRSDCSLFRTARDRRRALPTIEHEQTTKVPAKPFFQLDSAPFLAEHSQANALFCEHVTAKRCICIRGVRRHWSAVSRRYDFRRNNRFFRFDALASDDDYF